LSFIHTVPNHKHLAPPHTMHARHPCTDLNMIGLYNQCQSNWLNSLLRWRRHSESWLHASRPL